jgi:UDP-N-acetylmuramate--alanine ligase
LRPLEGRRFWFCGIGGAGMSALAVVCRDWGAEVSGWDRVRTPYLDQLANVQVEISPEPPRPPEDAESIVSTAFAERVTGRRRGELLAELVALRPSIVVAGAHGKTTTAAMIAYCLDRFGNDPAFLIGGLVPQLGGNARAGEGWLVAEGDESDRSLELLRPRIGVVTNVDFDHHATFASSAEVAELFERWLATVPTVVHGERLAPLDLELALPGKHNRHNAACAAAALEAADFDHDPVAAALGDFEGVGRRFEFRGDAHGVAVYDDYGHHPAEVTAALAAARARASARVLVLFQPHLYSRTRHLAREFAVALAAADSACVTDVYAAREDPVDGVTGKLIVDALAEVRPGMAIGWTPAVEDGVRFLAARAQPGDLVLTLGAGDVDQGVPMLLDALR